MISETKENLDLYFSNLNQFYLKSIKVNKSIYIAKSRSGIIKYFAARVKSRLKRYVHALLLNYNRNNFYYSSIEELIDFINYVIAIRGFL